MLGRLRNRKTHVSCPRQRKSRWQTFRSATTDRRRRAGGSSLCYSSQRSSWLLNYSDISQTLNILTQASDSHTLCSVSRLAQTKTAISSYVHSDGMTTKETMHLTYTVCIKHWMFHIADKQSRVKDNDVIKTFWPWLKNSEANYNQM